uniref:Oxidative stress 3 n=1 Tax=Leersia perrieri TaxID=77586 RepID=A0A0D9V5F8_9ORYZ
MGKFSGAAVLPVYHEEEDEDLFDTSSSISGDSDDEAQFSDSEEAEAQEHQFAQQAASPAMQPARRLNSDSLYDLSSMMAQLPAKKGLSKYYDGKSQSFACMSEVRCLEDLRKKENPYKKIKSSKSYVALDGSQQACHIPDANSQSIAKKSSASSCANLMARNNAKSMLYRAPPIPVNKSGYHQ